MLQQGFGRSSAQNRGLGGDVRLKSGEHLLVFLLLRRSTENGDLAWTAKAQLIESILPQEIYQFVVELDHVLRRWTRGDNGIYLHRAPPRAMRHRRCVEGYDRVSSSV